jgi:hypothetical protein
MGGRTIILGRRKYLHPIFMSFWPHDFFHFLDFVINLILVALESPSRGHFTYESRGPWPLHFRISCWSKRPTPSLHARMWSKEFFLDEKSTWISTWQPIDNATWHYHVKSFMFYIVHTIYFIFVGNKWKSTVRYHRVAQF